ncbi:MAG: hypothetical protein HOE69_05655 [Euryarchaeota archaeon]|jgi:hypothetical protein|nr:hypothetical protein [Euryarchaeota archaeon]
MGQDNSHYWFGDLIAYTVAAPLVRRWRDIKIAERTKIERFRCKIAPILIEVKTLHNDLLLPAWC